MNIQEYYYFNQFSGDDAYERYWDIYNKACEDWIWQRIELDEFTNRLKSLPNDFYEWIGRKPPL